MEIEEETLPLITPQEIEKYVKRMLDRDILIVIEDKGEDRTIEIWEDNNLVSSTTASKEKAWRLFILWATVDGISTYNKKRNG